MTITSVGLIHKIYRLVFVMEMQGVLKT